MIGAGLTNMNNIYEFGCETIQGQENYVYKSFEKVQRICERDGIIESKAKNKKKNGAKITGAIVAEVFRKNIEYVLEKYELADRYKISENNVYVKGCNAEFDFLILKKEAKRINSENIQDHNINIELPIYDAMDVVAVLESKTYGIYTLYRGRTGDKENEIKKSNLYRFVSAYKNTLLNLNSEIKIGYMCLVEQRPNKGVSNFIEKTLYFFEDYFDQKYEDVSKVWYTYFSKCQFVSENTPDVYATNEAWEKFIVNLVK